MPHIGNYSIHYARLAVAIQGALLPSKAHCHISLIIATQGTLLPYKAHCCHRSRIVAKEGALLSYKAHYCHTRGIGQSTWLIMSTVSNNSIINNITTYAFSPATYWIFSNQLLKSNNIKSHNSFRASFILIICW